MKNTLLVPEFREMLSSSQIEDIQDFCNTTMPSIVADFLGALAPDEVYCILSTLSMETRVAIILCFDDDVKTALLDILPQDEIIAILAAVDPEERSHVLNFISPEKIENIKNSLKAAHQEEILQVSPEPETASDLLATLLPTVQGPGESLPQIAMYKTINNRLEQIGKVEKDCWVNVLNPGKDEVGFLAQHFNLPQDFLTASLDIDEIARIEVEDNATLIILKIPYFDETNLDVLYFTLPIGIILMEDMVITVCAKNSSVLTDFSSNRVRNFSTAKRRKFILQLFLRATMLYLQYLKQINNAANIIQKKLEISSKNKQLIKLLNIEKSLVYFTTSLKSNAFMLERLQKTSLLGLDEETQDLIEDIVTESKQAIEMANIYSDILSGMMDAFASIISNNLNIVMKALSSIAIIITLPLLLASLYGMNVKLPFQNSPHAFGLVLLVSAVLALVGVLFFMRRKWLEM
ncbi:MAG TPA: CorA family divalent cation transporter [Thermodesulfobacteriota bacterium]|nr:hypothetical protein [Deltaproteobacteria bacterium]HNR14441.1 CorA family divalent cation transporter [Thermodesulfobacteriota bacterium]HNU71048.1 CorA family divalent cation transporter [Thermodesulfobacteriota bacterium]HOC37728.1 CorA family divalent cation transporter [Thermodesulfobacteriota bacterium]